MKCEWVPVIVLAAVALGGAGAVAADDDGQPVRVFNLTPSLEQVLTNQLDEFGDAGDDPFLRQQRTVAKMSLNLGPEGGGGGGSSSNGKRPGEWLVGGFDKTSRWATLGTFVALGGYFAWADEDDVRELGDITQLVPAATALGLTLGTGDWEGLKQLGLTGGTSIVMTHGIKQTIDKTRPDTSANNSFPSGHTSASVTGAAFIWRRYGPKWGAPASLFATYTGLSRVLGQKHFMDDVLSGAAIGLISNWLWTDPIDDRVQMALFPTKGGAGFNVRVDPSAEAGAGEAGGDWGTIPTRYFLWEIGGADVAKNRVVAPNPGGTPIDFQFNEENDPTTTAFIALYWSNPRAQYDVYGVFAPFEIREVVELEQDLVFGGATVPAGTVVQTRYLAYDYRAGFGWAVVNRPRFRLLLGGSAAVFSTEVGMVEEEGIDLSRSSTFIRPTIDGAFDLALGTRWILFSNLAWWGGTTVTIFDGSVQLGYRIHPKWALSLGYRRVERTIEQTKLYTNVDRNHLTLGVFYAW